MKKISTLLTFLILVGLLCVPAVAADEILYDNTFFEFSDTSGHSVNTKVSGRIDAFHSLKAPDITKLKNMYYITIVAPYEIKTDDAYPKPITPGSHPFTAIVSGRTFHGNFHYEKNTNILGQVTSSRITYFFDDWDVNGLQGSLDISFSPFITLQGDDSGSLGLNGNSLLYVNQYSSYGWHTPKNYEIYHTSGITWENRLVVTEVPLDDYQIDIIRLINGEYNPSTIKITDESGNTTVESGLLADQTFWLRKSDANKIELTSPQTTYVIPLEAGGETPSNDYVTVYVRNSQTGALLANAYINISASVNGNLHEVVNETAPSGIYSIDLQPTGGGMPNPDFYRLITTAEGYNSIMPHIDFEFDEASTIYAYLDPIGGSPEDENNTFIDFFVRDMSANPISGATVNFGGYTLITNSAGYTIFEVDKNKTYSWTVSKSGYGSLTGNAIIGGNARHTINTVIAPAVTPTTPTPIPTSTPISPTPTMTSPTGEPVSNWLEWFAAHFGMILGGGAEIGKIFMWLCFAVPAGVYVGKEAKAGAAGFLAGAGIVTLFFVLIGWVPIWLLVLLALIIGLLYAKIFNNSDNGGGR